MSRSQSSSRTSSSNKNFLSDNLVSSTILVVLLVYAVFIVNKLPPTTLALFDNWPVRFVFVCLILALALSGQYAAAILLTVGFVMSIQAANRNKISKFANMVSSKSQEEPFYQQCGNHTITSTHSTPHTTTPAPSTPPPVLSSDDVEKFSNCHCTTHAPSATNRRHSHHRHGHKNEEEQFQSHENQHADAPVSSEESSDHEFTTPGQFDDAQDNRVSLTNQHTEVRTWVNELGPQGLSQPSGYSGGDFQSPFNANTCVGAPLHD